MYCLELAGEDDPFAAREAATVAAGVEVVAPGVAVAGSLRVERVRALAYTRYASELLGRTGADVDAARVLLAAAGIDREGSVAVRARDVRASAGVSTSAAERELGSVLVERGFAVDLDDPDHVLRAVFADDACVLGWQVAESERSFGRRKPTDRPFFQPGSMAPMDARALANLAGAEPGARILDPMCGTGGVLIEAGLVGADVLGADAQRKMVRGARENLREYLGESPEGGEFEGGEFEGGDFEPGDFEVLRGDATRLALRDGAVDGVVFDAPYGRQSKIERHDLADLVAGALAEARRVAPRAVLMADRSWEAAAAEAGWTVEAVFERRVHRSLTRYVHILDDT
ncbi:MAG: TIGR01177 family methyltransferase [Haloferacaceae archaeon]